MQYSAKVLIVAMCLSFFGGVLIGTLEFRKMVDLSSVEQVEQKQERQEELKKAHIFKDHSIKIEKTVVYSQPGPPVLSSKATSCDSTPQVVAQERVVVTYSNVSDALTDIVFKKSKTLINSAETKKEITKPVRQEYHLGIFAYLPMVSFESDKPSNDIQIIINGSRELFLGFSGVVSANINRKEIGVGLQWTF